MNDEARMLNGGARANFQASSIQLAVKPRFPKAFVGEDEEDEEEDWRAETGLSGEIRRNPAIEFKKSACRTGNHEFLRLSQNEALAAGCRPNSPARCRRSGGGACKALGIKVRQDLSGFVSPFFLNNMKLGDLRYAIDGLRKAWWCGVRGEGHASK